MRQALLISGWLALLAAAPAAEAAVTTYVVVVTIHEPDTQPNDTIFTGSFGLLPPFAGAGCFDGVAPACF